MTFDFSFAPIASATTVSPVLPQIAAVGSVLEQAPESTAMPFDASGRNLMALELFTADSSELVRPLLENAALAEALKAIVASFTGETKDTANSVDVAPSPRPQEVVADGGRDRSPSGPQPVVAEAQPETVSTPEMPAREVTRRTEAVVEDGETPVVIETPIATVASTIAPTVAPTAERVIDIPAVEAVAAATSVSPAQTVIAAASAVADAMYVTPGQIMGDGEIVVQLRPEILDGSTVKIVVTGREVAVSFTPSTPEAAQILEANVVGLKTHLAQTVPAYDFGVVIATTQPQDAATVMAQAVAAQASVGATATAQTIAGSAVGNARVGAVNTFNRKRI